MRSNFFTFVALASSVAAQIPGLPNCAGSCLTSSYGGCGNFDVKCICSNTAFLAGLSCCVYKSCDSDDQQKTIKFADSLCQGYGVNNLPQSAGCAADQLSTAGSSTSTGASTATSAPATTTPSSPSTSSTSEVSLPASLSSQLVSISSNIAAASISSSSHTSSTGTSASHSSSSGTMVSPGSGASKTEAARLGLAVAGLLAFL